MNICIIGTPRSRSTFFVDSLKEEYNLKNWYEHYDIGNLAKLGLRELVLINKENTIEGKTNKKFEIYQNFIKSSTNELLADKEFNGNVIKFWGRHVVPVLHKRPEKMIFDNKHYESNKNKLLSNRFIYNLEDFNPYIVTDFSNHFQLQKYNKLYILDRNILDSMSSLVYSIFLDKRIYQKNIISDIKLLRNLKETPPKLNVDTNLPWVKFGIFELAVVHHIEKYLLDNQITYTKISYDEIPNYVKNNFPKYKEENHITVNSNLNYNELISNYDEFSEFVNKFYKQCLNRIENLGIKFT